MQAEAMMTMNTPAVNATEVDPQLIASTTNVRRFDDLMGTVTGRRTGLPGLGSFYGPSGDGKTWAATRGANRYRAHYIRVKSAWTRKSLVQAMVTQMGLAGGHTVAEMVDQVSDELQRSQRPLIVDEADYLVSHSMIEIIRDIHEASGSAIVLIGEEQLPVKLKRWERVHGRMLMWQQSMPADLADVRVLAGKYLEGVELDKALLEAVLKAAAGSTRRVCVNLSHLIPIAEKLGRKKIGLADWGERDFYTGNPPTRRPGQAEVA
jgi:DNA transposition AAA+ family ATPase